MKVKLLEDLKQLLGKIKEKKDVSNLFICVYDDSNVGLFKQKVIKTKEVRNIPFCPTDIYEPDTYDLISTCVYIGVFSNIIGMKDLTNNRWKGVGHKVSNIISSYTANCNMQDNMSFDDMRLIMYSNGIIDAYEPGKATIQEMLEVLKYAVTDYELDNNKQMTK